VGGDLDVGGVGGGAGDAEASAGEDRLVLAVKLLAMTAALDNNRTADSTDGGE
jgi:hypothetical protein